ncbi:hypothetical protein OSB04_031413, partial [Centaurea solstitialis]
MWTSMGIPTESNHFICSPTNKRNYKYSVNHWNYSKMKVQKKKVSIGTELEATVGSCSDLQFLRLNSRVLNTPTGLFISQHRHIQDILHQFNMDSAKDVITTLYATESLSPNDPSHSVDALPTVSLLGLSNTLPSLIRYILCHQQTLSIHACSLPNSLASSKTTIHHSVLLNCNSPLTLSAFSDSNWGGVNDAGLSTTAYILYFGTDIISWKSTRQKSDSRSSTKAEYKALANASAELMWNKSLLKELYVTNNHIPTLFCDNTGTTYLCANPVYHSRMKHIALDYDFYQLVSSVFFTPANKTKLLTCSLNLLPKAPFLRNRSKIGVSDGSSISQGFANCGGTHNPRCPSIVTSTVSETSKNSNYKKICWTNFLYRRMVCTKTLQEDMLYILTSGKIESTCRSEALMNEMDKIRPDVECLLALPWMGLSYKKMNPFHVLLRLQIWDQQLINTDDGSGPVMDLLWEKEVEPCMLMLLEELEHVK